MCLLLVLVGDFGLIIWFGSLVVVLNMCCNSVALCVVVSILFCFIVFLCF